VNAMPALKLTPKLRACITKHAATLSTADSIATAVNAELGCDIARRTVAKVLAATKVERADIAKNVLREQLSGSLISDLEVLLVSRNQLEATREYFYRQFTVAAETLDDAEARANAREHRAATAALKDIVHTRLHYSGAGEPDDINDEASAAAERVRSRLARLATRGGQGVDAGGDSSDPK